jgi:D-beta-D-heptose 7-phosphate kinase/D-beta-D-heptose 1-phosphate adenosyltransferase
VLLAALSAVDFVVPFHEETPEALIREVISTVLVKGEDWREKGVVGREWVEQHGGSVYLASLLTGRSTTGLVDRIRGADGVRRTEAQETEVERPRTGKLRD